MNEVIKALLERRSCKKFKDSPVDETLIQQIVRTGLYAANGLSMQSPIIIAVSDKAVRDKLSQLNSKYDPRKRADPFYGAPVVLAVLADKSVHTAVYDGSLVIGNMLLAAHTLGVGSCWIHRAKEVFYDEEGKAILSSLGIEGDYEGIGFCVLGEPDMALGKVAPRRENRVYYIK